MVCDVEYGNLGHCLAIIKVVTIEIEDSSALENFCISLVRVVYQFDALRLKLPYLHLSTALYYF